MSLNSPLQADVAGLEFRRVSQAHQTHLLETLIHSDDMITSNIG